MENKKHITSIGGQAVLEGVMMRGPKNLAIAVRKSDGEIVVDKKPVDTLAKKYPFLKLPIIRGVVSFFESMVIGTKALMFSADIYDVEGEEDETYKPSKFDEFLEKLFGNKDVLIYTSMAISLVFGVLLFVFIPAFIVGFLRPYISGNILKSLIEGAVKIGIFVLYLYLVSKSKDIQRVFQYHGAEHKSIHCYENGYELTVENVKKCSRLHPRCGTSFLLEVLVISILVFSVLTWDNIMVRVALKLLLLPFVAGISYEFLKFCGKSKNPFIMALNKPGMWLQNITTREPDDSQIEVAIVSLNAVLTGNPEDDKW